MSCICISIEGSDGAGKATTTRLLIEYLSNFKGYKVATLSFPRYKETTGGKLCYEVLKSDRKNDYDFISLPPRIASMLYAMDRAESRPLIENLIEENDYLIFDRYTASNFIHQGGKIQDDSERIELISFLHYLEHGEFGLPEPDITFFLYLPTEVAMKNKEVQRQKDENVKMDAGEDDFNYLENSNKSGLWCVRQYGWKKIDCIDDAKGTQKDPEAIVHEIFSTILKIQ